MAKAAKQTTRARTALQSKPSKRRGASALRFIPEPSIKDFDHAAAARIERELEWLARTVVMAHVILSKPKAVVCDSAASALILGFNGDMREASATLRRFADIAKLAGERLALAVTVAKRPKARPVR